MPKPVADLICPEPPPPRQPHAAIVEVLREDKSQAFTSDEILEAVCARLPSWRANSEMLVTHQVAISAALSDLMSAGIVVELSDGTSPHYHIQQRIP